jgi:hypothetical protein
MHIQQPAIHDLVRIEITASSTNEELEGCSGFLVDMDLNEAGTGMVYRVYLMAIDETISCHQITVISKAERVA